MNENSFSEIFDYNNRKAIFYLNSILEERKMTFNEAFNKLLADYQPVRELKWLTQLRSTFNVKLFPEHLEKSFQEENISK